MIIEGNQTKYFFYVNKKARADGSHIIHTRDCWVMPNGTIYVGRYVNFSEAIRGASQKFSNLVICPYCEK